MRKRDEEVLVKATDTHRMVREGDRWEDLLPLVPTAPTYRLRTVWRIEAKSKCQSCGEFLCSTTCEFGEADYPNWGLEAKITITESRGPAWPFRVEMEFGSVGLSSTNDPQTMLWLAELLREVATESAAAFDIPIAAFAEAGVGAVAEEIAS